MTYGWNRDRPLSPGYSDTLGEIGLAKVTFILAFTVTAKVDERMLLSRIFVDVVEFGQNVNTTIFNAQYCISRCLSIQNISFYTEVYCL